MLTHETVRKIVDVSFYIFDNYQLEFKLAGNFLVVKSGPMQIILEAGSARRLLEGLEGALPSMYQKTE